MVVVFWRIIAWFATFGCFIAGIFSGTNHFDLTATYKNEVASVPYENTMKTAVPQTEIYKIIKNHFLKDTGTVGTTNKEKKVIVIGYDGCRADNLSLCGKPADSAINTLISDGGHLKLSYCGGVQYPMLNTQRTSTAPGWCSMLTGCWATEHGVTDNSIPKSNDHLTLLTSLVEDNTIDSSAFYVSWGGHFSGEDSTYINEKNYVEEKGLNAVFSKADNDDGTLANVLADVKKDDCSDFIFSILEYCDHIGHDSGFSPANPEQQTAFADAEKAGLMIIDAIKARENYDNEDWLIIITTDHGGYNNWHGGPTMQERYTFIAANKDF